MKLILYIQAFLFFISAYQNSCGNTEEHIKQKDSTEKVLSIPDGLQKLVNAYPEFLEKADENNLYWKDGTVMIYDDGIEDKTHDEMLNDSDLEDMMSQKYTKGRNWNEPPPENFEPGRIRYEPFFLKMYGNNSNEVSSEIVNVTWVDGSQISFSNVNGAADSLEKVAEELSQLPGEFHKYLKNIGGTFVWRNIAGTDRLSNHSFGTAIDINTMYSDYWKWNKNVTYVNRIPIEIAEVFEKYGFIWGGKWYHYDTMHFEFRPELTAD
ncbi:MAG TPA: M15 family metallopeptidase [Ignavibacteria bacterium]|nr:M15 family metallopeptidase [Ignavibacteria bacterium]HQY52208.1 M15 family metallopeptidase [Ignavibacteria bacterium]HRA98832.1 M15 family metallopeptidase [Ignavibacteria bacterium]